MFNFKEYLFDKFPGQFVYILSILKKLRINKNRNFLNKKIYYRPELEKNSGGIIKKFS